MADSQPLRTAWDGTTGEGVRWKTVAINRMGEALMATPAISEGMLIVRGQQHIFAVK